MKKWLCLLVMMFLLAGCGAQQTYETIADEEVESVMAAPRQILVDLPGDVLAPVLKTEGEQVYLCQDYEIIIETRSAGDLRATVEALSGFSLDEVTMITSAQETGDRHEFVWACVGEAGDRIGRAVILDDGNYHYCMSVLRDAESKKVSQISWEDVFSSFRIAQETPGTEV